MIIDMRMTRLMVTDHEGGVIGDLNPRQILALERTDELNGEHSLTITTTQELFKNDRILLRDATLRWYEYVVQGEADSRLEGGALAHEYWCVWSLQHDLSETYIDTQVGLVPGHHSVPNPARAGLEAALSGTGRWGIGTITVTASASGSFYRRTGWEGLSTVVEKWGGEVDAEITVGQDGVTSRNVALLSHIGDETPTRRFDYRRDLMSIKRTVLDDPWTARIVPLGKSSETEAGGYTRRPTIGPANGGVVWIEDADAVPLTRISDGSGGWEHPVQIVINDTYEEPADLLAWATAHVREYTQPRVKYEATVAQFGEAGLSPHGVSLGDEVAIVDHEFKAADLPDGLRLSGRVVKIRTNLLDASRATLTLGTLSYNVARSLKGVAGRVQAVEEQVLGMSDVQATAAYLSNLLSRINDEVNATGGYTYITEGQGIRTYDRAVTDPLVGSEATQVVEIKGGNLRIANSRTAQGDWDWRTVLVSGHILADLVTAAKLTAGYIGSAQGGTYWDLDAGELRIGAASSMGGRTVSSVLSAVDATITGVDVEYAESQSATTAPTSGWSTTAPAWREGWHIWQRTATTTAGGTTYSTPVMISGRDGANGTGIASTTTTYGTSGSASTEPTSWSQTAPTSIPAGQWLWVRTVTAYTDGTSTTAYTKSYAGTNGADGTSVTILGSYDTVAQLEAAHPTGSLGDSYIVAGDLYVWDGDSWENVGQIQGPQGAAGTSVTVSRIEYGTSTSASTQPSSWSTTAPSSIAKGRWLWVRTTYSDSSTAITKSYVGTDGEDGASVSIQSVTKSGGTTTVRLTDADGTTKTLTIEDGEDGANGTAGANGYVHTAWANSADGTEGFSTTVSAGKSYLGVYTDNTAADSTSPSAYSWSLIKGADGAAATTYSIAASVDAIARAADGTIAPSSVTFSATSTTGTGTPAEYAGRIRIQTSTDGETWTNRTTSSSNVASLVYTPTASVARAMRYVRGILFKAGGTTTQLDQQTVAVVSDGATGDNGTNGADAYTVMLTNEAHTFAAGTSAAIASTTTSYVVAYKGATQVTATIGTISGAPRGMSTTVFYNGSTSARFAVSVSNLLTTEQGTLTVPVTVDGHVFNLVFSWSLAFTGAKGDKGDTGSTGADGTGVSEIVEQYYLSRYSTSRVGGSWSTEQPQWETGKFIWTRSAITWSDGTTTYTDPVLAQAVNGANQSAASAQSTADAAQTTASAAQTTASAAQTAANAAATAASDAAKVATNYLSYSNSTGLDVGYSGTSAKTRINGSGLEVFDGNGTSALFAGLQSNKSIVRVGRASGSGNIVLSEDGYIDLRYASTVLAHFGYGEGKNSSGGTSTAPYYTLGERRAGSTIGNWSVAEGGGNVWDNGVTYKGNVASGAFSHAEGVACESTGHASHAEGYRCVASGDYSHAGGTHSTASGQFGFAHGWGVQASTGFSIGLFNSLTSHMFIIGTGNSDSNRRNGLTVDRNGNLWIDGTLTQNSDRRLKEHRAYLGEDAADFVRRLRPALFTKDGERHLGFYAQDVAEAEPDGWDTATVTAQHTDESLDFDPLTLDYTALIAPLVAYAQGLEARIEQQQGQIDALTARLDALEGRQ